MTTNTDGNQQPQSQAAPTTETLATSGVQQGSETVTLTKELFDALQKRIDQIERLAQGDKDRAVKRTNERLDRFEEGMKPLLEQAQQYIAKGSSVTEAIAKVQQDQDKAVTEDAIREMALAWKKGQLPNSPAGNGQGEGVNVIEVITDLNLDPNDPVVKSAFDGKQFTLEQAEATAARIVREKKKQPIPTSAQMPTTPSQPTASKDDLAVLMDRFEKAKKFPTSPEYREVKQKLDERGWK